VPGCPGRVHGPGEEGAGQGGASLSDLGGHKDEDGKSVLPDGVQDTRQGAGQGKNNGVNVTNSNTGAGSSNSSTVEDKSSSTNKVSNNVQDGTEASLEALALYEDLIEARGEDMDPRVSTRILQFKDCKATDYIRLVLERAEVQKAFWKEFSDIDAVVAPTVAVLPPKFADVEEDEAYFRLNNLVLRNTMIFNFLGVPAVSVPSGFKEGLPVGFMMAARPHEEALALSVAHALERSLSLYPITPLGAPFAP
jgi:Asp-tRNA(Asn)/Glu-tRNA(Gln) amidotransferase A subunit family amidase